MVTTEQGALTAFNLTEQAAHMLEAIGDTAGALRLRHTLAIIRNDARYPVPARLETPVSLMKMALALMDRDETRVATTAAAKLQGAIDAARNAKPLQEGEELDPNLIPPNQAELEPPQMH